MRWSPFMWVTDDCATNQFVNSQQETKKTISKFITDLNHNPKFCRAGVQFLFRPVVCRPDDRTPMRLLQRGEDKMASTEAEVTSSPTSPTATAASLGGATKTSEPRSSIPRSKALISQTSVDASDQSQTKTSETNGTSQHLIITPFMIYRLSLSCMFVAVNARLTR